MAYDIKKAYHKNLAHDAVVNKLKAFVAREL